jgi:hypothetical protein
VSDLVKRRGGPTFVVVVDLLRDAWRSRNLALIVLLLLGALAVSVATLGHTVIPYVIYPFL